MKNYIIIFSGYNQRAIIAFLRTLVKNNIDNFLIFAASENDTILKTCYAKYVYAVRKNGMLEMNEIISFIKDAKSNLKFNNFIIAPSTEALNRFVLHNADEFKAIGGIPVLPEKALYEKISDKKTFSEMCTLHHILVPEEFNIGREYKKAFVAKPVSYFDKDGNVYSPVLVKTKEEFCDFIQKYNRDSFYYQEYIKGRSIYLLYYFAKDGKIYNCAQENFMQQADGKSILVAKPCNYHMRGISELFADLLSEEKYYGFIMIEIRVCSGKEYMIEANPRFWGPSQLFVDMGYNFFEIFLKEYGFISSEIHLESINYNAVYYWHGGTVTNEKECPPSFYNLYEKKYQSEKNNLIEHDIYRRNDTMQLFFENC